MARPMPVLPLVASMTVWPGLSSPDASAALMTPRASRSFTEPSGLKVSTFTHRFTLGQVHTRRTETINPHHGRVAHSAQNAVVAPHRLSPCSCLDHRSYWPKRKNERISLSDRIVDVTPTPD